MAARVTVIMQTRQLVLRDDWRDFCWRFTLPFWVIPAAVEVSFAKRMQEAIDDGALQSLHSVLYKANGQ